MFARANRLRPTFFSLALSLLMAGLVGCAPASRDDGTVDGSSAAANADALRQVLERQAAAWNEGDLVAFMQDYAQTDTLRFASGGSVWRGWQPTLQRYQESYPDGGAMGTLSFDSIEVDVLGAEWALAFGRWRLARSESYTDVSGLFTLLFRHTPEGWKIVYDHTSSSSTEQSASAE